MTIFEKNKVGTFKWYSSLKETNGLFSQFEHGKRKIVDS